MLDLVVRAAPLLLQGTVVTLMLGVTAFALALPFAIAVACAHLYGKSWLDWPSRALISAFIGTPLLVQILLLYYGLPEIGIVLPAIPTVIAALVLHSGCYMAEDCRGAIGAVARAQWDAGKALGLGPLRTFLLIILPQALRSAVPTLGSRFIAMMKETSLASVVTVTELTRVAETVGAATFRYIEIFVVVALIYWVISFGLARLQFLLERRLAVPVGP